MINGDKDPRIDFANDVCKLIWNHGAVKGDPEKAWKWVKPMYDHFKENVRNIYQFIDTDIPLFYLYELKTFGAENWDYNEDEYKARISLTISDCKKFYSKFK